MKFFVSTILALATVFTLVPTQVQALDNSFLDRLSQENTLDTFIEEREVDIPQDVIKTWAANFKLGKSVILRQEASMSDYVRFGAKDKTAQNDSEVFKYDLGKIFAWIKQQSATSNRVPQDAELVLDGNKVKSFKPDIDGVVVDVLESTLKTTGNLSVGNNKATLVVRTTRASITLEETNDLGIKELVTVGTSNYSGSPVNRRHNVKLGASRVTGTIVGPGETFSFNKAVGEISARTGYKEALVIKASGTVPEAGGGMCQVSSTVFRAAMNGGMKITTRRNHAYSVQYYMPPGTDATTYDPTQDFRFINDTPKSILIWAEYPDSNTLVFKFYGTKDTRVVDVKKPIAYDKKPDGSLKAEWSRTVTLNGETREDTFKSVYLSPNLFHKNEQEGKVGPNGLLLTPVENTTKPVSPQSGIMNPAAHGTTTLP